MDKCIKVLIPTGEILLKFDGKDYSPNGERSKDKLRDLYETDDYKIKYSIYKGWVIVYHNRGSDGVFKEGDYFKAVAQYGDEFPA